VAAIAAIISYRHMSGLLAAYGEEGVGAILGPLAVDGLMVVSSGALMAVAHNRRLAARAEDAPEAARDPAPIQVPDSPAPAHEEPPEQVPEGGAGPSAFGPDIDATALLEALGELAGNGGVSGAKLSEALARRGVEVNERDARRVLAVLRPGKPSADGEEPPPESPPAAPVEPITAAEPVPA
jgi:hypothetical protein